MGSSGTAEAEGAEFDLVSLECGVKGMALEIMGLAAEELMGRVLNAWVLCLRLSLSLLSSLMARLISSSRLTVSSCAANSSFIS